MMEKLSSRRGYPSSGTGLTLAIVMALGTGLTTGAAAQSDGPANEASDQPRQMPAGYHVETIEPPANTALEVGGLAWHPNGDLYVTTRYGEVWIYRDGQWLEFADGLHQPLGVHISSNGERIFVAQKPGLTELVDTDDDDRAELYKTINDGWGMTPNYHEYVYGPARDRAGNFYLALNLAHGPGKVRGSTMGRPSAHRGWVWKVTPEGQGVPFASGFRSPAGINMSPSGDLFVTDNQGDWVATSALYHVQQGHFYGHPAALSDDPRFKDRNLDEVPVSVFKKMRTLPAVRFPHRELAQSPGNLAFDTPATDFSPFDGQMFVGDQTSSNIMRISLEKVDGHYQGVIFNFIDHLQSGVVRATFEKGSNSLWVGQTSRGWSSVGEAPYGLQKVVYDGETTPYAIKTIRLTPQGFRLVFTKPVDREQAKQLELYQIRHWGYQHTAEYGSPRIDMATVQPQQVSIGDNGRQLTLSLPGLKTNRVYKITAPIAAASGETLSTHTGFYTLNRRKNP
jgi:glucose/arabinose dehydrogenase